MRFRTTVVVAFLFAAFTLPVAAQQSPVEADQSPEVVAGEGPDESSEAQIQELSRRIDLLATELELLRSGETPQVEITTARRESLGLAPSAATTYRRSTQGVSLAGYGEMLLENFSAADESGAGSAPTTRLDFLRAILYAGYRFNDKFLFNSEIEVEHSNKISVEFAYVDYLANDHLTLRGGMVLLPLGLINEFHEPTVFTGAKRPETEQRILPTTWRENGAGILGSVGVVNFRAYVTNGLRGAGFSSAGLRGGRQNGAKALAANLAFSGRLDVTAMPGVVAGLGLYKGGSGQEQVVLEGARLAVGTTVVEVHGRAQMRGFDLRALFAQGSIDQAEQVNLALNRPADSPIADTMQGGYVQASYNIFSQTATELALSPYVRYEQIDTQHGVPTGFARNLRHDGIFKTLGIEMKPIQNVAIKTDYQWVTNEAGTGRNQFNVNLGYAF
jgi:hypothetical protein